MDRRQILALLAGLAPIPLTSAARAAGDGARELRLGVVTPPNSLDPHFYQSPSNNQTLKQIFDPLVVEDLEGRIRPWLAETWRPIDDVTWEFKLRPGIRFHDGTPLEPEDVAFSIARIPTVPNSPGSFIPFVRNIADVIVVDRTTFRFRSKTPNPFLDRDFTSVLILSRRIHANAATADFTSGRYAIGTGAFRYAGFTVGQQLDLVRNPDFWGTPTPWSRVRARFIADPGSRVAGLLAGDLDLIDAVPIQDVAHLATGPGTAVFSAASATTAYLFPDSTRDRSPFVTDRQGAPLPRNPFRDPRVRRALSLAINRPGIVNQLLAGQGIPADQFAPPPAADRLPGRPPLPYDPAGAKRLLAEAGYPDGFGLTIHGPSGFFAGDSAVLQAIAQGLSRVGIETRVDTLPPATFFGRATNRDFSLFLTTYAATSSVDFLRQVVLTKDPDRGTGPFNRQLYSNSRLDESGLAALTEMEPGRRQSLTHAALTELESDLGVVPVFYPRFNWAGRRSHVTFEPGNPFGHTNALFAKPV